MHVIFSEDFAYKNMWKNKIECDENAKEYPYNIHAKAYIVILNYF